MALIIGIGGADDLESIEMTGSNALFLGKTSELSRNVAIASDENQGMALGLMGLALTLLARDLLMHELQISPLPSPRS